MTTIPSSYEKDTARRNVVPRVRISPLIIGIYAVLLAIIFLPVTIWMINAGNDFPMHIHWAWYWDKTGVVTSPLPHFLYQVVVRGAAHLLPGDNFDIAAAFVSMICYVSAGILILTMVYPAIRSGSQLLRSVVAAVISLVVLLAGPVNLLTWASHNLFHGYIPTDAYHNPTMVLLKPLALLVFLNGLRVFTTTTVSRFSLIAAALLTALCTLAKPNFTVAIIPALGLFTAYSFIRKQPINWPLLIIGIGVPAVEILLWQLNYVRGTELGGFEIAPFLVMTLFSPTNLLPKFLLSILFPLVVTLLYWREAREDKGMGLAWLAFAAGAFYTYFIAEKQNPGYGNFAWSGQVTLFVLFVTCMVFLIRQNRDFLSQWRWNPRFAMCMVVIGLHLLGGIAMYLGHLGADWRAWL